MPDVSAADVVAGIDAASRWSGMHLGAIAATLLLILVMMMPAHRRRGRRRARASAPAATLRRRDTGALAARWKGFRLVGQVRRGRAIDTMSWEDFERLIAGTFRRWGYSVKHHGLGGPDGGVDLVADKNGQRTIIQCKRWNASAVGAPEVRQMLGLMMHHNAHAVAIVTSGRFTAAAIAFARGKPIELIDGEKLHGLLMTATVRDRRKPKPN